MSSKFSATLYVKQSKAEQICKYHICLGLSKLYDTGNKNHKKLYELCTPARCPYRCPGDLELL